MKSTTNCKIIEWNNHLHAIDKTLKGSQRSQESHSRNDPFDCSHLIIPYSAQLVKNELQKHVQEWEELDTRIVQDDKASEKGKGHGEHNRKVQRRYNLENDNLYDDEHEHEQAVAENGCPDEPGSGNKGDYAGLNWGWHANRIRLPDFFDYTCKGNPPESILSERQNSKRRKVISLEDPTQVLDYEAELWEVFQKVPHESEIEASVSAGSLCRNLVQLKEEIIQESNDYTRLDAHALSRLRRKDRHHWPRISKTISRANIDCATIRIESWRRHTVRCSKNDANRCELEFLSTQTLLDVHNAMTLCAEDQLFHKGTRVKANVATTELFNCNTIKASPGYFFIEDTFYTVGDVDYVTPILQWLNEDLAVVKSKKGTLKKSRKRHLGIPDVELKRARMQDVKLGDLSMRLAHRYVHVYNGDCETAIFFTDVAMRMKDEHVKRGEYPLVHDIWTNLTSSLVHNPPICHGCEHCPAVVLTLEDELTDGGPTPLCADCYKSIHYTSDGSEMNYNNFQAVPLAILQNLKDLSVGHDVNDALF